MAKIILSLIGLLTLCQCASWLVSPDLYEQELPNAATGEYYEYQLEYEDHSNTVSFNVTDGELPGGFYLSGAGILSGTPVQSGIYEFEVTLTEEIDTGYNDTDDDESDISGTSTSSTNDAEETDSEWFTLTVLES